VTDPGSSNPFAPFLRTQGFVLLDGGLATALEERGHDLRDSLWSAKVLLEAPEEIRQVHLDYLRAGADCIATATYQATFEGLRARGLGDGEAEAAFRLAVRLAVEARDDFWADPGNREGRLRPLVAASVGPYGAYLANGAEYTGAYSLDEEALLAWHRRRWHLLATSPADLLACETIPSFPEARALLRLLAGTPARWAWISFQCRDYGHLADGTALEAAAAACDGAAGVAGMGLNCVSPALVSPLLERARSGTDGILVAYPNSGEHYDAAAKAWRPPEPTGVPDPASEAPRWLAQGAAVLGGCCRIGPDTIARMRRALLAAGGDRPEPLTPS
jgi:homocysteine S-methyltransferase